MCTPLWLSGEEELALRADVIRNVTFDFANEVIKSGSKIFPREELERFKMCIQCGKCTGGCPSGRRTAWRVRKILEDTRLGLKEKVFADDDLWNCTTCYTCQERCPRGVHATDIVRIIRNLAVKNGHMKNRHRRVCEIFFRYGHLVPINDEMMKVRKELGLAEIPPTVLSYAEELKGVLKLVEDTGFKKIVEGNKK